MKIARKTIAAVLVAMLIALGLPVAHAKTKNGFKVENAGGSLPIVGDQLTLSITSDIISIHKLTYVPDDQNPQIGETKSSLLFQFIPAQVTSLSYGSEEHHRIGTGVAVGFLSLGAGLLVACSKSKKHFIGINWSVDGARGGIALRVDKGEYRRILAALEGVTGKTAVNTDQTVATKLGVQ